MSTRGYDEGILTILGDGLYGALEQLVEVSHVEEMEGEEVAVEDGAQDRTHKQHLQTGHTQPCFRFKQFVLYGNSMKSN